MKRNITVIDYINNQRVVYNTENIKNLKDLYELLEEMGHPTTDVAITEGVSRSNWNSSTDPETELPTDIQYKGESTNDLVLLITDPNKKFASGMNYKKKSLNPTRKNIFEKIKKEGLQSEIVKHFGRNMTLVKTSELENFLVNKSQEKFVPTYTVDTLSSDVKGIEDSLGLGSGNLLSEINEKLGRIHRALGRIENYLFLPTGENNELTDSSFTLEDLKEIISSNK